MAPQDPPVRSVPRRATTPWLAALIGLLLTVAVRAAERPNLLVILADDLGFGDVSLHGAPDLQTPHIDRLAAEGLRFDAFRANCTVCSPTRAAFLTGCFPDRAGVPGVIRSHADDSWGWLRPDLSLLPEILRRGGYHTALVGKWHLGLDAAASPNRRGFDLFHGFLGDMMDDYLHHRRHGTNYMRRNGAVIDPPGHATDLFTDWACDYLRGRAERRKPFFLYLAYNAPHGPVQPPADWLERVRRRAPDLPETRAKLVALIEHLDAGIGRVLETLESTGLSRKTLVVFTSDNGGDLRAGARNAPWRDGKGSQYDGGLRVPAFIRWPGHVPPGSRTATPAVTMDLFPTLLEAAGMAVPSGRDGMSLLPVLADPATVLPGRSLYFTRREGGRAFGGKTTEALVDGDWKLVQTSPFGPLELFHLGRDPAESEDLAEQEPRVFNRLHADLRRHLQRGGAIPWQAPKPPAPPR